MCQLVLPSLQSSHIRLERSGAGIGAEITPNRNAHHVTSPPIIVDGDGGVNKMSPLKYDTFCGVNSMENECCPRAQKVPLEGTRHGTRSCLRHLTVVAWGQGSDRHLSFFFFFFLAEKKGSFL